MPISYDKLWKLLIDKKMNRTDLKDASGISFNVLAKMGKNEAISMESLYKICAALDCGIGDIVEFINDESTRMRTFSKNWIGTETKRTASMRFLSPFLRSTANCITTALWMCLTSTRRCMLSVRSSSFR